MYQTAFEIRWTDSKNYEVVLWARNIVGKITSYSSSTYGEMRSYILMQQCLIYLCCPKTRSTNRCLSQSDRNKLHQVITSKQLTEVSLISTAHQSINKFSMTNYKLNLKITVLLVVILYTRCSVKKTHIFQFYRETKNGRRNRHTNIYEEGVIKNHYNLREN